MESLNQAFHFLLFQQSCIVLYIISYMANCKREVVVFNSKSNRLDAAKELAKKLEETKTFKKVWIFTRDTDVQEDSCTKVIPDTCDTLSKARNFINAFFKEEEKFGGFLHVVEDLVEVKSDPSKFINQLEKMMDVLDYGVWFNTTCDPCNYVYSKFNPRVSIDLDREDVKVLGLSDKLLFTSHSNTAWICYNFSNISDDLLKFSECFDVPMFMIIEYLARRRNTKSTDQIYFMNMYATIPEEVGVFKYSADFSKEEVNPKKMASEDKLFKEMNINFSPDNNVDLVLESVWDKLKSKIS